MVVATAPCDVVAVVLLATSADGDECGATSMLSAWWLECEDADASCAATRAGANVSVCDVVQVCDVVPVCDVVAESFAMMSSKSARVCKSPVGGLVAV